MRPGPTPKTTPKHGHGGAGWQDVPNLPYTGPGSERELPKIPGMSWMPQVEGWWEVARTMPHCVLWEPGDWLFSIETALLKDNFYREFFGGSVHATMATEIRRREDQMGMTMEARRKNGIRYVDQAGQADTETQDTTTEDSEIPDGVRKIGTARSRRQNLAG